MLSPGTYVFDLKQESPEDHVADVFLTSEICSPTFEIQVLSAQCPPAVMAPPASWRLDYDPESPVNLPWWPHSLFFQPSQRVTRSDCLFCLTMCGLEVRLVHLLWARCLVLASCAWIHLHLPGPFVMNSPQQWTLLSQFMCSQSAFSVPPLMRVTGA